MGYSVKEIYFTLQGEGGQAGRPAVFCRFAGCNLWTGREKDRERAACWFCDTDFVGTDGPNGGSYENAQVLAEAVAACWPESSERAEPCVVFTGGEPLLQLDETLVSTVKQSGFFVAVETNGTLPAPAGIDWLTVSPKPNSELMQQNGMELKLVYPHEVQPEDVAHLPFRYFFLSPRTSADPAETKRNLQEALAYCRSHPQWRLTMQYHRIWNIP